MGVYNNNKDGTRSTLANTIQVVDAPMEQFVSRGEFSAVTPSDVSANNKLVAENEVTKAVSTMPTASSSLVGTIVQYVGTTTANYTNGYFYKCVSDGAVTPTYSWVEVISGGGSAEFVGTMEEWNALTTEQKNSYDIVNITDDGVTYKIGVPSGGTTGQILAKKTNNDYDLEWINGSSTVSNDTDFIYVAHQGLATNGIPENTLEAFLNALNDGFSWIEVDIRRSSDGIWVMSHNSSMSVYDSNGNAVTITIANKTIDELRTYTYDVEGLYHIAILSDVLCKLKRYNAKIIIDNKISSPNYEEELLEIINTCGMTENVILTVNVDWALANINIINTHKKTPIRVWCSDYAKTKTLIDSIENEVYIDMSASVPSNRTVTLPLAMALNRPIISAGLTGQWGFPQNKHVINVIAGGMMDTPITLEQMKNGLNYQIGYSDMTISGADPYIDVTTNHQITVANNNSGSGYVNTYTADPLIATTVIDTIGETSQVTITAQSEGTTKAYVLNGSVCRAIRVQSAPNGFWIAGDIGNNDHAYTQYDYKAVLLEFTHENTEKLVVASNVYNIMHRYNLDWFNSYNVKMPTIPEGATKFYASFLNDVAGQFYIKFYTENFVVTSDSQGWQSTKEKDIPSGAKYICIGIRYSDQAKLMANNGNDPEARARFKALQDAVSYRFE